MQRIDGADVSGTLPVAGATVAPGYFTEGNPGGGIPATVVTADWANMVQEEIVNAVVDVGGLTLDKATDDQLATTIAPVQGLRTAAGGAGALTTQPTHTKALLATVDAGGGGCEISTGAIGCAAVACGDTTVDGLDCGALASDDSDVQGGSSGINAAAVASRYAEVWGDQGAIVASFGTKVSGSQNAVIASGNGGASTQEVTGDVSAIIASGDTGGADPSINAGDRSAIIAGDRDSIGATGDGAILAACAQSDAGSTHCAGIASYKANVTGSESAVIASTVDGAGVRPQAAGQANAVIACMGGIAEAASGKSAAIGCEDSDASAESSIVLASEGVENGTAYSVAGGRTAAALTPSGSNQNQTWRIESISGDVYSDGTVGAGAADYAETFELEQPGAEIPAGVLVTRAGRKIRIAGKGDRALGVISARPAIIGNTAPLEWAGRWKVDEAGQRIATELECIRWPEQREDRFRVIMRPIRAIEWKAIDGVCDGYSGRIDRIPDGFVYAEGRVVLVVGKHTGRKIKARAWHTGELVAYLGNDADKAARAIDLLVEGEINSRGGLELDNAAELAKALHLDPKATVASIVAAAVRWAAAKGEQYGYTSEQAEAASKAARQLLEALRWPVACKRWTVRTREPYNGLLAEAPTPTPDDATAYKLQAFEQADGFDSSKPYTPRHKRPTEWGVVGLLGQLPIRVAEGVDVDDDIIPGDNGIGVATTKAAKGARIEVMEILSPFDADRGYAIALCLVR